MPLSYLTEEELRKRKKEEELLPPPEPEKLAEPVVPLEVPPDTSAHDPFGAKSPGIAAGGGFGTRSTSQEAPPATAPQIASPDLPSNVPIETINTLPQWQLTPAVTGEMPEKPARYDSTVSSPSDVPRHFGLLGRGVAPSPWSGWGCLDPQAPLLPKNLFDHNIENSAWFLDNTVVRAKDPFEMAEMYQYIAENKQYIDFGQKNQPMKVLPFENFKNDVELKKSYDTPISREYDAAQKILADTYSHVGNVAKLKSIYVTGDRTTKLESYEQFKKLASQTQFGYQEEVTDWSIPGHYSERNRQFAEQIKDSLDLQAAEAELASGAIKESDFNKRVNDIIQSRLYYGTPITIIEKGALKQIKDADDLKDLTPEEMKQVQEQLDITDFKPTTPEQQKIYEKIRGTRLYDIDALQEQVKQARIKYEAELQNRVPGDFVVSVQPELDEARQRVYNTARDMFEYPAYNANREARYQRNKHTLSITTPDKWTIKSDGTRTSPEGKTYTAGEMVDDMASLDNYHKSIVTHVDEAVDWINQNEANAQSFIQTLRRTGDTPETRLILKAATPNMAPETIDAFIKNFETPQQKIDKIVTTVTQPKEGVFMRPNVGGKLSYSYTPEQKWNEFVNKIQADVTETNTVKELANLFGYSPDNVQLAYLNLLKTLINPISPVEGMALLKMIFSVFEEGLTSFIRDVPYKLYTGPEINLQGIVGTTKEPFNITLKGVIANIPNILTPEMFTAKGIPQLVKTIAGLFVKGGEREAIKSAVRGVAEKMGAANIVDDVVSDAERLVKNSIKKEIVPDTITTTEKVPYTGKEPVVGKLEQTPEGWVETKPVTKRVVEPGETPPPETLSTDELGVVRTTTPKTEQVLPKTEQPAQIPTMITHQMESDLKTKGFTQQQIDIMTPQEAWNNLKGEVTKGTEALPKTTVPDIDEQIAKLSDVMDETKRSGSLVKLEKKLGEVTEGMVEGLDDVRTAIKDYRDVKRKGMTPDDYIAEKESAWEAVQESLDNLTPTEQLKPPTALPSEAGKGLGTVQPERVTTGAVKGTIPEQPSLGSKKSWQMTNQEFLNRGYDNEMVNELKQLPQRVKTPQELAAQEAIDKASEALRLNKLSWVFGAPKEQLARLPKTKLKLYQNWENAVDAQGKLQSEMRTEVQSYLHKQSVERTLSEGKPVPPEVLKDYPELAQKYGIPKVGTEIPKEGIEQLKTELDTSVSDWKTKFSTFIKSEKGQIGESPEGKEFYDATVQLAKSAVKYGVKSAEEFARYIGVKLTEAIQKAWDDAIKPPIGAAPSVGTVPTGIPPIPPAGIPPIPPTGATAGKGLDDMLNMLRDARKPVKQSRDLGLKFQEQANDIFYGIRQMQGRVAKTQTIQPGGKMDFITNITRNPGSSNAGYARYEMAKGKIKSIAPDVEEDFINSIVNANHYKEVLTQKGTTRVMAGGFTNPSELDTVLGELQSRLGVAKFNKAQQAAEVIRDTYKNELGRLVDAGLFDSKLAQELNTKYPWYNPLKYAEDLESLPNGASKKTLNVINNGLKRLTEEGTAKAARSPMNVLMESLVQNEVKIVKNDTTRSIVKLALEDPTLVNKVTKKSLIRPVAQVEDELIFRPYKGDIPGTLSFFEKGKRQVYEVPEFISREATELQELLSKFNQNSLVQTVGAINGISRSAFTTYNPAFILSNMMNDSLTAFIRTGVMPQEIAIRLIKNIRGLESDKLLNNAFSLSGAKQQRFYGADIANKIAKNGGKVINDSKSFGRHIIDAIPTAGEMGEQAPRMTVFEKYLKKNLPNWKTMTAEEIAATPEGRKAAANAVEATINFGRGSFLAKSANPFVIFLNASMEGMKLPYRAIREGSAARWRLAGVTAGITTMAAYNLTYPEYFDVPNEIRWGSVVIMLPSTSVDPKTGKNKPNYVTVIPRTREWGAFLGTTTYAMEKLFSQNPTDFGTFSATMAPQLIPFGDVSSIIPTQVLQETVEQIANYDFYRHAPIVSQSMEDLPTEQQTQAYTSPTIERIANMLGWSPVRVQHGTQGLFGGAGNVVTSITDVITNLISPPMQSGKIEKIAKEYEAAIRSSDKNKLLKDLSPQEKQGVFAKLKEGNIPIVTPVVKRVLPGRGGQLLQTSWDNLDKFRKDSTKSLEAYKSLETNERLVYRSQHPEIDAALFILGDVTVLRSTSARKHVDDILKQRNISEKILPKKKPTTPAKPAYR